MKKIILSLMFLAFSLSANNEFTLIVKKLIEHELKSIIALPIQPIIKQKPFETTKEFNARVAIINAKQDKLLENYKIEYALAQVTAKSKAIKQALEYTWGKPILSNVIYEEDSGNFIGYVTFEVKKDFNKKVAIIIKKIDIDNFYKNYKRLKIQAVFDYDGVGIKLKRILIPLNKRIYPVRFIK